MSNQGLRGITPDLKNGVSRYSFIGYTAPSSGIIRISLFDIGKRITINSQVSETSVILPKLNTSTLDRNIIICNVSNNPLKVYKNGNNGTNFAAFLMVIPPKSNAVFVCTSIDTVVYGSTNVYGTWAFSLVGSPQMTTSSILLTSTVTTAFTYCKLLMFDDYNGVIVASSASGTVAYVVWITQNSNMALSSLTTLSANSVGTFSATKLTSNSFAVATSTSNYLTMYVQVISVNLDGALSFNTIGSAFSIVSGSSYYVNHIASLNTTQLAISYILNGASEQYRACIISVTGTTCSLLTNNTGVGINGTGSNASSKSIIIPLTSSSFLWLFDNYNTGNVYTFGIVCTLSGSTLTYNGTPVTTGISVGGFDAIANSSTQVLVLGSNATGYPMFVLLSISGTTISTVSSKQLTTYAISPVKGLVSISDSMALALVRNSTDSSLRTYTVVFSNNNIETYPYELIISGSSSDTIFGLEKNINNQTLCHIYNKSNSTSQVTITSIKIT